MQVYFPAIPPLLLLFCLALGLQCLSCQWGSLFRCTSHASKFLARYCSPTGSKAFNMWKEYYKANVGALHVWSWRVTPITGSMTVVFLCGITRFVVELVFLYTTVMGEPDIPQKERFKVFRSAASAHVVLLIGFTILLLVFTAAMGMVHVRFATSCATCYCAPGRPR